MVRIISTSNAARRLLAAQPATYLLGCSTENKQAWLYCSELLLLLLLVGSLLLLGGVTDSSRTILLLNIYKDLLYGLRCIVRLKTNPASLKFSGIRRCLAIFLRVVFFALAAKRFSAVSLFLLVSYSAFSCLADWLLVGSSLLLS